MTSNGVITLIWRYFTEFDSFPIACVTQWLKIYL